MLRKRFLYKIVGLCIILFVLTTTLGIFKRPLQNDDSDLKISQLACQPPDLPVDNPEMMKFYKPAKPINCGNSPEDWVICKRSICYVKPKITDKYGEVNCSYTDIIQANNFSISYGKPTYTTKPYVLRKTDFVQVSCRSDIWFANKTWSGYVYGIRNAVQYPAPENTRPPLYNVLIFGFDSMSRNAFMRKLPKSYEYLTRELKTIVLKGYNIVGDGTSQALVPILTGFTELELSAKSDEGYPTIWNEYAKQGYVSSLNEDLPILNKLKYLFKQPVHHYLQTFYIALGKTLNILRSMCIGHRPSHMVMLDYTKNFMWKYKETPGFIFSFLSVLSYESIDDDFLLWLQQLKNDSLLEETILIVMSDHGNRLARNTLQGRQEERLPFFSFTFPDAFKKRYPHHYENFLQNSNRLSTPFDVHATLKHILALQPDTESILTKMFKKFYSYIQRSRLQNEPERAISLFKNIPKTRSCADAYIEPHWCACLKWKKLSLHHSVSNYIIAMKAAESILNTINNYTNQYYKICARLRLKGVNWLLKLNSHYEDSDGLNYEFTEFYQIQIVTTPGNALFEASVQNDLLTHVFDTKIFQISRINNDKANATCIYFINPDLRKYCYCQPEHNKIYK